MDASRRAIDATTLLETLLAEADDLHHYVAARIPRKLRSTLAPNDVLQQLWIAAFRGLPLFRPKGPNALQRWLTTLVQRLLIDAIRTAKSQRGGGHHTVFRADPRRISSMVNLFARVASPCKTPSSEAATSEAVRAVQIALAGLPDAQRCAVQLYHIEGKSRREVAQSMQMTEPAVNGLLFRGMRQLEKHLGEAVKYFSDTALIEKKPGA